MTPVKMIIAVWILALIPSVSTAQTTQIELANELFEASHWGNLMIVQGIVDKGANVNAVSNDGSYTAPMHAAASKGSLDIIQYFIARGAYLNPRTVDNWIPLHHAVRFGHRHVVSYLLAAGAPLYMETRGGQTVFDMAQGTGDVAMLNLLERYR